MDRNREARRASILGSNGFNRRRHRTNSLRDSPADEDGGLELQETVRLRDRVKKDRDRERDRDRDRDRERERERERGREGQRERDLRERSSRSKRRRAERLTSNREDTGGDETSEEESLNDDEDDEDEENATTGGGVRLLTQAVGSVPNHHHHGHISNHHHGHNSSFSQQQHNSNSTSNIVSSNNHHLQHRKSFPQNHSSAKISRAPPVWKSGDEMISVPVPRKARSASTKRSHDWISMSSNNSGGVSGVEQNPGQASTSPARQGVVPTLTPTPPAPVSPTSPNASIRKKPKPSVNNSGPKVKPPKVAAKPSSSNPEELEIEIAEVLYGLMTQSQAPLLKKDDSREINRLSGDAKSRNSSPISNSASANNLISGSHSGPLSAVPPKRKRPRQIPENSSCGARSSSIQAKPDVDRKPSETSSPCTEKTSGSTAEKGYEMTENSIGPQAALTQPSVPTPLEPAKMDLELKPAPEELRRIRDPVAKEEGSMKEKGSPAVRAEVSHNGDLSAAETTKPISVAAAMENRMEEKFEIDLMAPPPHIRPSPDREVKTDLIDSPVDQKPVVSKTEANLKSKTSKDQTDKNGKSGDIFPTAAAEENNAKWSGEEAESNKAIENERDVDLRLDLENSERDGGSGVNASKSQSSTQKQQQQMPPNEKSVHLASSLPLPMSVGSWPGGLPPMGYMAPLQGVVSMEGGAVAPGHIPQPLFGQPRPKRCATHCHIARNIHYIQQCSKMNPFWPAPAASASLFGSKPCNLIGLPGPDLHGNVAVRGANSGQDKGQNLTSMPNHVAKEKGSHPANTLDSAQRKQQILVQQALPPVAPSNLLGPAFIFPMNQQQSAAPRPSGAKSPVAGVSSNTSAVASSSPAAAVGFNFPNMGSSETPYLAILQNNGYTFPIPAGAVGAPQNYRGTQAQAMPMFNGSFYSSQMIHPSQLQQAHQNASASGVSSMPQKQQQRMQSGGAGNVSSSLKTQPSQQVHNQYGQQTRPRHHEGEPGREDSPSTTDSRGSRVSMNIYGQNFAMPIHPQNFGLMTHPAALASSGTGAAMSVNSNHGEKKQGSKTGPESLPAHSFAMTFGTMNGTAGPGMEWVQTHAAFQSSSEATRQNMQQMMAAAASAQAAHNFRDSDDGKSGGADSSATEDERKSSTGKTLGGGGGQSIAFTRSDLADEPLNAAAGANRGSRSMSTNSVGATNVQNAHSIQTQLQQQHMLLKQQQQQMAATAVNRGSTNGVGAMNVQTANSIHQTQLQQQHMLLKQQQQLQQQQQIAANAANRSKAATATSNGGVYSEHLSSSSTMAAKFPTGFPQNLVQSNSSSPSQSPQWKASGRTSTSQPPSSLASSATPTLKNLPQQHSRTQAPMHTQISFGGNQKPSPASQGQAHPTNNQTTSSQMMVGSPTTSSVSKGASGSPRTASSASTTNKVGQASSLSAQPSNNSPSVPNQKSTSILGNPQVAGAAASGNVQKSQLQHQSHQQMPKAMQQQFFFSNPYAQSQSPQASKSSTPSGSSGYYMTRRQNDQHQQSPGAPVTSAVGLSLCPPTNTNDPATAIAAATANVKGGALPSQGIAHAQQFAVHTAGTMLPAGFSYAHPVPTAVQVKPVELKQPAGNDNLRTWQSEKK